MTKQIEEIFKELRATRKPKERIKILQENDCEVLRQLLRVNFDTKFKFLLPEGVPPFKKSVMPEGMAHTTLKNEWRKMYVFKSERLTQMKRESLFIDLLEALSSYEAQILCDIKDKKLSGVTLKQVKDAYPDFVCN
jgi:hypothetical protein